MDNRQCGYEIDWWQFKSLKHYKHEFPPKIVDIF